MVFPEYLKGILKNLPLNLSKLVYLHVYNNNKIIGNPFRIYFVDHGMGTHDSNRGRLCDWYPSILQ